MKKTAMIFGTLALTAILTGCGGVPSYKDATKASLWNGNNAEQRMMNILSPHFSISKVRAYINWQNSRGCNTTHVILANAKDGEGAGYCIYGPSVDWTVDDVWVDRAKDRINQARSKLGAVVVWLMTDDSGAMNRALLSKPAQYVKDLADAGLFDQASIVCIGLELSDYADVKQAEAMCAALRGVWKGKIATHDVSGSLRFAHVGDIVFAQVSPETSDAAMMAFAAKVKATGKPCGIIEHRRNPDRARCEKLIAAGLPYVGNW
jgi:hypothetical protein